MAVNIVEKTNPPLRVNHYFNLLFNTLSIQSNQTTVCHSYRCRCSGRVACQSHHLPLHTRAARALTVTLAMNVDAVSAKSFFALDPDLVSVNAGSYGSAPKEVLDARFEVLKEVEREPDLWYRYTNPLRFNEAADLIADTYNSPRQQLTLVDNVSYGICSILNSLELGPNDQLLLTAFTYPAIRMQCQEQARRFGLKLQVIDFKFPINDDSILEQYNKELQKMSATGRKIAIVDHVSSAGAIEMPLEGLLRLCEKYNVLSLVDAAHAPGQLTPEKMDLSRLRPDFYVANLYKWAFVPRPSGFLYVAEQFVDTVRPIIVSWTHQCSFRQRFLHRGCSDTSGIACIPAAHHFTARLGGMDAIQAYVRPLVRRGMELIIAKTNGAPLCDEQYSAPMMIAFFAGPLFDKNREKIRRMIGPMFQTRLHHFLRTEARAVCPIIGFLGERVVIRICAHVYSDEEDFRKLADGLESAGKKLDAMTMEEIEALPSVDWMGEEH